MEQNRVWFFQSNPKQYDIDAALAKLDQIWWRVPQHTGDIRTGDVVMLWRSVAPDADVSCTIPPNAARYSAFRKEPPCRFAP